MSRGRVVGGDGGGRAPSRKRSLSTRSSLALSRSVRTSGDASCPRIHASSSPARSSFSSVSMSDLAWFMAPRTAVIGRGAREALIAGRDRAEIKDCAAGHVRTPRTRCCVKRNKEVRRHCRDLRRHRDVGGDALRSDSVAPAVAVSVSRARALVATIGADRAVWPASQNTDAVDGEGRTTRVRPARRLSRRNPRAPVGSHERTGMTP